MGLFSWFKKQEPKTETQALKHETLHENVALDQSPAIETPKQETVSEEKQDTAPEIKPTEQETKLDELSSQQLLLRQVVFLLWKWNTEVSNLQNIISANKDTDLSEFEIKMEVLRQEVIPHFYSILSMFELSSGKFRSVKEYHSLPNKLEIPEDFMREDWASQLSKFRSMVNL